jgi:superfamily II DNA/RNA helicase
VSVTKTEQSVPLSEGQHKALDDIDKHSAALRIAKMEGTHNLEAAKALSPAMFEGVDEADHEAVAKRVADSVGILKESATKRVLNAHPESGKLDALAKHAAERKGKQGVVFAHSLEAVEAIRKRLEAEGHRVATISGKDSSKDKAAKIQAFNPDKGEAKADIIVCSDAGATGANLQSGQWLVQYDTPDTAMGHAQRAGRINRIGQKNAIELTDLIADHASERRARSRLATKYGLRSLMTSPLESIDDTGLGAYLNQSGHGASAQDSLF